MATYNKRGFKAPKPAEVNEVEPVEEVFEGKSTTAEVFESLDKGASRTEEWVEKNQKTIFIILGAVALVTILYLVYDKMFAGPKEEEAATEMFQAEKYFTQAVDAPTASDSLYNLSLKGGEGKLGFLGVIENYSGTDAANNAQYFAGMAYLNMGKYKQAVEHLDNFKSKDEILTAMAKGGMGDAFAQLGDNAKAIQYYEDAVKAVDNDMTSPRFMFKAAQLLLAGNKKAEALKYFNEIKEKYSTSQEAMNIDAYISRTE